MFRLEPDDMAAGAPTTQIRSAVDIEYFWLCSECANSMTLRLDEEGQVSVQPLVVKDPGKYPEPAIVSRRCGLLLRSVGTANKAA